MAMPRPAGRRPSTSSTSRSVHVLSIAEGILRICVPQRQGPLRELLVRSGMAMPRPAGRRPGTSAAAPRNGGVRALLCIMDDACLPSVPLGGTALCLRLQQQVDTWANTLGGGLGLLVELTPALLARVQADGNEQDGRPNVEALHRVVPTLFAQAVLHHGAASAERCVLDAQGGAVLAHLHVGRCLRTVQLRWPTMMIALPEPRRSDQRSDRTGDAGMGKRKAR